MNFEINDRGGWIVPAFRTLKANTVVPAFSEVATHCNIGADCYFGEGCTFERRNTFDTRCMFGARCSFSSYCDIGAYSGLGDGCILSNTCTLRDACRLGKNCFWAGVEVDRWLTLANVDGTGRQIVILRSIQKHITVIAGCFIGTPEEFYDTACSENKLIYAAVIPAVCEILRTAA